LGILGCRYSACADLWVTHLHADLAKAGRGLEEVWKGRLGRCVSIPSGSVRSFWKRGIASPEKALFK
jgi:hypothetical protein